MGCGCGGQKGAKVTYIYTDSKGKQTSWRTEIEAKAAQIRSGGGGSIRSEASK